VAEVVLQGPGVMAIIGQLEPAGMAKHVRVDGEWHLGGLAEALDEPMEPNGTDWPAALGNEYVGLSRVHIFCTVKGGAADGAHHDRNAGWRGRGGCASREPTSFCLAAEPL